MLEQLQSKAADVRQVRAISGCLVLGARYMEGDRCLTCLLAALYWQPLRELQTPGLQQME